MSTFRSVANDRPRRFSVPMKIAKCARLSLPLLCAGVLGANVGGAQVPECDRLLDATYDALPDHEKRARLTAYGGCWMRGARAELNRNYRDVVNEVRDFEQATRLATDNQIRTKATTVKDLMDSQHAREIAALQQQFEEEVRALELQRTADNNAEIQRRRNAITTRQRQAMAELRAAHSRQANGLTTAVRNVQTTASGQITDALAEDRELLALQLERKLTYLQRKYDGLLNVPDDASIDSFEQAQRVGAVREVSGDARFVAPDGSARPATLGAAVNYGDVVWTGPNSAVDVEFDDGTSFAFSEDASLEIDEYLYDPNDPPSGSKFNWLKGIFVFTSGLLGRDDPLDIDTDIPTGNLGIRG
jgi:hypothetical protein